jgi:hypothetical protein
MAAADPACERSQGEYRLASLMSARTDLAIFRLFRFANTLVLLHQQSEIAGLQEEVILHAKIDRDDQELKNLELSFEAAADSVVIQNGKHYQKLLELREKLVTYSTSGEANIWLLEVDRWQMKLLRGSTASQSCLDPTMEIWRH